MTTEKKIVDLQAARRQRRDKTGWSIDEIRRSAARRAIENREHGKDEPPNLASGGDMNKIIRGEDDRDEADE
ncbi:MAG TPA: hypothetical protein VF457_08110 [Burkholderiaceae bacterium]